MEGSGNSESGFEQGTPAMTPSHQPGWNESALRAVNLDDLSPSSVVSLKEGSRSSSLSSSDSESESYNPSVDHYHGLSVNTDGKGLLQEIEPKENKSYEELLIKFIKNDEELKVSNLKLQVSEKEIVSLKGQIERNEGQLDHLQKELKTREADLKYEKEQLLELVEELEVAREQLKASNDEIARLRNELDGSSDVTLQLQGQLEAAQQCVATFKAQLDSGRKQIQDLEDRILWFKANESNLELEMQKLNAEILDFQTQFSLEKEQLQSEISSLSKEKIQLDSRLEEWESRSNLFENKVMEYEAEKLKQEELHTAHQMVLQDEVSRLKEKLDERRHGIESLNNEFDRHKHKYDMLMTEKDGANAMIQKLTALVSSRDNQIENMEWELRQLRSQQAELTSISEARFSLVNELKLKVEELETEVTRQKAVISDRAEEKREAIRQLCLSLEHYRSGYQELRQAFLGHKRYAVIAS